MTQPNDNITEKSYEDKLKNLFLTGNREDFMFKCFQLGLQCLIEAEFEGFVGAGRHERSDNRTNYRNGYRERKTSVKSSLGELFLNIPKVRKGSYYPSVIAEFKYSRTERALIGVIQEAYINGVSTRSMERLFVSLGIDGLDKSTVSRLSQPLHEAVEKWRNRDLDEKYKYIWLDATYIRCREDGASRNKAVLIAKSVDASGQRDILGLHAGQSEAYTNWKEFFQQLKNRGLKRADLWISDAHEGLAKALREVFPNQDHQRCIIHWQRNFLDKLNSSQKLLIAPLLTKLVKSASKRDFKANNEILDETVKLNLKNELQDWYFETIEDVKVFLKFPEKHYVKIKSTNPLERVNKEIKRRTKAVGLFPSVQSIILLIGSILQHQAESWINTKKYI